MMEKDYEGFCRNEMVVIKLLAFVGDLE